MKTGRPKKDRPEGVKKTTAYIPFSLHTEVRKKCLDLGVDMADAINQGLGQWLAAKEYPAMSDNLTTILKSENRARIDEVSKAIEFVRAKIDKVVRSQPPTKKGLERTG